MGKSSSCVSRMMQLVLILSTIASLASADLCFDGYEVAAACTAGTDLGNRLMSALYQCDYNTYSKSEKKDEDWHDALNRRSLNRQDNCHDVADIEQDFYTYMSYGLCLWENIGWYNLTSIGYIDFDQYQTDVNSLAPSVSESLSWGGEMGSCWSNMTSDIYDYFSGCDYSSEDWETLAGIVFVWSDMTCFGYIFDNTCSDYLRNEIYYYFGQKYDYYSDYTSAK